jgi:hypothetical protein
MVVIEGRESGQQAVKLKVENNSQWGYPRDDSSSADGCGAESAGNPAHSEGVDSLHTFDVSDDTHTLRRVP